MLKYKIKSSLNPLNSKIDFLIKLFDMPINIATAIEAQQFLILWIPIKGIFNDFNIVFLIWQMTLNQI